MEAGQSSGRSNPVERQISGWIGFAGITMIILGSLDALWGLAALLNNEVVVVGGHGVMILDVTAWGWVQLILGLLIGLTGLGLLTGNGIARVLGIFLVALNAVLQVVWFSAAPLWSLLVIALDVVIVYQLTAGWIESEVDPGPGIVPVAPLPDRGSSTNP